MMRNSVLFVATLLSLMLMNFAAFAHDGILFPSNTDVLPTAASLKELIPANNERQQANDFSVMADEPILTTHDTLWGANTQCLCDSIRVIHDIGELKTLFGISDAGSGEDVTLVSSSKTLKNGKHCADTVIIAYVVADATSNQTTFYHAQFIQDTIRPTFTVAPKDTALCVDPDGNYENTVARVAAEITIANLHDSCTKVQDNFSIQSSIDTSPYDIIQHPRGYKVTNDGVRHYKQLWTVTDSCGNTTYDSVAIHVRPLPKINGITKREQAVIYGDEIDDVFIYYQYSDLSITGPSGIGLDTFGYSVEVKKDYGYDRVHGYPEFAVSNATFHATATSPQGWGCGSVDSTFIITVEQRPIVITATDATKKYDGTPLTSTDYTCTTDEGSPDDALVHDDVISRLSFSCSQTNVGSCTNYIENARITAPNDITIDKTSSYWIDYYNGTLTVTVNDTLIKVVPGSASKVYDGSPLTKNNHDDFTVTGVPEGLTWAATADGTVTNVVPGEGEKAVNAVTSFQIFNADSNNVTSYFTNIKTIRIGKLTILPASVLVNADAKSKVYGEADPPLTATITGVLEGENFIPNYTISRETGNNVGQYIITPTGDVAQGNYAVTYDTALFTITPKVLTITVNNAEKTYGQADPTFTGTVQGLVNPTTSERSPISAPTQTWRLSEHTRTYFPPLTPPATTTTSSSIRATSPSTAAISWNPQIGPQTSRIRITVSLMLTRSA